MLAKFLSSSHKKLLISKLLISKLLISKLLISKLLISKLLISIQLISIQKATIIILFAVTVLDYLFRDDPSDSVSFRFLLLACAFVILWLRYSYDMLLIFSLVFVAGVVLQLFLGTLGIGLSIALFPIVGIMFVLSRAGSAMAIGTREIGNSQLHFPPIKFSFLLNSATALLCGTIVSIIVFLAEHHFPYEFPFELLISTFLLFWLWFQVEKEQKGTRTRKAHERIK